MVRQTSLKRRPFCFSLTVAWRQRAVATPSNTGLLSKKERCSMADRGVSSWRKNSRALTRGVSDCEMCPLKIPVAV